jgi:plasmid segregation protein ParM
MTIIPIDHGNSQIKTENFIFTSGLEEHAKPPAFAEDVLEYAGKIYTLSGKRVPYMRDKSKNDRFFLLTLFGIAKELEKIGANDGQVGTDAPPLKITLAAGIPPAHFQDGTNKRFKEYLKAAENHVEGTLSFAYNGKAYSVEIADVKVFPQAYAAIAPIFSVVRQAPLLYVVDIGGMTVDTLLLRKGKLDTCESLDKGVITMKNRIANTVNARENTHIEAEHIDAVLNGEETELSDQIKDIIKANCAEYAENILYELTEQGVDMRGTFTVFIGGGALMLREYIKNSEYVGSHQIMSNVNANAVGYKLLAEKEESGRD